MVIQASSAISLEVLEIIFTIAATCAAAGFILGYYIGKGEKK